MCALKSNLSSFISTNRKTLIDEFSTSLCQLGQSNAEVIISQCDINITINQQTHNYLQNFIA